MKRKEDKRDLQREQKRNAVQEKKRDSKPQLEQRAEIRKETKTGLNHDTMNRMKAAPKVYKKEDLCMLNANTNANVNTNAKTAPSTSLQFFSGKIETKGISSCELWKRHKTVIQPHNIL
jgi:hypothetical protein